MTESMPPTRVQRQKLRQALAEKVLDKACEDPKWKQQLIEDPELAMREANFPEFQQIQQLQQEAEVTGQSRYVYGWGYNPNEFDCVWHTYVWQTPCLGGFTQIN